jgi:uncharacterized membrane protein
MSLINTFKDHNSRARSLAKALTWRIASTLTTTVIVYTVIGELRIAAIVGSIEFIVKFITYYGHERAWNLVS